ncbi:MAG: MraY family glycosyltransferase [Patescibacteria group bacterium]|nr:MraY family glycosyltransferase [Patescibacteria group bacterium]
MSYFIVFLSAFALTLILTPLVKWLALKLNIIDRPGTEERKIHKNPTPLMGGLAILAAVVAVVAVCWFGFDVVFDSPIKAKHLAGVLAGAIFLMIGGILDDKFNLRPKYQLVWPILAAGSLVAAGVGIDQITNPFGGVIKLNQWEWWFLTLPSDLLTFVWILLMIYTTKVLDGLDGLAAGITGIGALMIAFLALFTVYYQPDVALLAMIVAGALAGFLIFNFYPAKIFLGESGSTLCGFLLGTLAIISGGKIATALLVMGIPVLDVIWVVIRRIFIEKRSPFRGDRKHLHFRLLDIGLNQRQAVLILYLLATIFGLTTLFLQSKYKMVALVVLAGVMVIMGLILVKNYKGRTAS